ncbi:hypothetical protein L1887_62688 [Cichorium endivia]|nr:hypothetical protein L1887_62688 [Cichorium endivia]
MPIFGLVAIAVRITISSTTITTTAHLLLTFVSKQLTTSSQWSPPSELLLPSLVRARAPLALARAAPVARAAAVAPRFTPVRFYAASAGLSKSDIESRIVDVLKTFEKVDPSKVCNQPLVPALLQSCCARTGRTLLVATFAAGVCIWTASFAGRMTEIVQSILTSSNLL